jgi:hypothetical protein
MVAITAMGYGQSGHAQPVSLICGLSGHAQASLPRHFTPHPDDLSFLAEMQFRMCVWPA